ncbi:MAG: PQQ-binding-like beta-propeller repeat protein [Deltaproteobacteria bacterium]|nr:PQQ-binding-like beta-propeller repeat protein [Deltaproteobacteria bacterium]
MRASTQVALVAAAAVVGCGGRSDLEVRRAVRDAPDVVADLPGCPGAALQRGAPAPVPGYCPTRANRSLFAAPDVMPAVRWTLDLDGQVDASEQVIVGPSGRLYVRVDPIDSDGVLSLTDLVAIDDRGTAGVVAWSAHFERPIAGPLLLADGSLLVSTTLPDGGREAIWLDRDGATVRTAVLPSDVVGSPAVAQDGSLVFTAWALASDRAWSVVAMDAAGAPRWRTPAFAEAGYLRLALGEDVVVSFDRGAAAWVASLDPSTGAQAWETLLDADAPIIDGPALGTDGAVYNVIWTASFTRTTLVVLEPDGTVRLRVDLPDPPWGGGVTSLAVGDDGTAYIKAGEGFVAIDVAGEILFRRDAHPNIPLGGVIDPEGTLLLGAGAIEAADGSDGTARWLLELPAHMDALPDGGAVFHFAGPATIGDETLYVTDYGARLLAASPPGSRGPRR